MQIGTVFEKFSENSKNIFPGGEVTVTISKENALLDGYSDDFAPWEEASDQAVQNEQIEEALALERSLEFESELEQDEHPRNYDEE